MPERAWPELERTARDGDDLAPHQRVDDASLVCRPTAALTLALKKNLSPLILPFALILCKSWFRTNDGTGPESLRETMTVRRCAPGVGPGAT